MWWTSAKATPRAITCSRWPAASDQSPRWKCSFPRATSSRTASSIGTRYHARESRPVSSRRQLPQARLRLARVRAVGRLLDEALQHLALVRGVLEVPVGLPGAPERVGADLAAAEVAVVIGEPDEPPCRALPRVPLPIEVRHVLLVLGQPLARFGDQLARARDVLAPRVAEHEPLQRIESGAQRALVLLGRGGQEPHVRRLVFPAPDAGAKGGGIGLP